MEQEYLKLLQDVLDNGAQKGDRTGTGTLSVFGRQIRHDLSHGFPLLTTKKIHFKAIVHELLWFISGDTNVKYLQDNGVKIWDEWKQQYSLDRELIWVSPKIKEYTEYNGDYSYKGINASADSIEAKLAGVWTRMLSRCYDSSSHNFHMYGACGISVCKEWHDCRQFIEDVKKLPHFEYKLENWNEFELDKDYYQSNQYGPDTCVWLSTEENNMYMKTAKPIQATDTEGNIYLGISLTDLSNKIGMSRSSIHRMLVDGKPTCYKQGNRKFIGWEFDYIKDADKVLRLKLIDKGDLGPVYGHQWRNFNGSGIDQLTEVIQRIKDKPNDRRLIISAWNPMDVPKMALPPCHCFMQFYVSNGKLSCQMYQRSADMFLGVPFNIASYALLTMMIAQVTGLQPGEFIHTFGDTHIYNNHIDQVKLQLSRRPYLLPIVKLNPNVKNIEDFKYEDIELTHYISHDSIKAKVAV